MTNIIELEADSRGYKMMLKILDGTFNLLGHCLKLQCDCLYIPIHSRRVFYIGCGLL